ncbi:chemotaxis protein CheA [Donghicola sp.]|jgi:two-component system chemotaxis sensor kinase CheA|uniref:chemotaxis protein CheA n=1 Tax=Donghicola sp. TaxID=1929294 RepID=UPI0025DBEF80|nr:chemotaxis protein CheA [Donghicola sp.]MCT4578744.1 chemotaxis protein CheA [Donghicola sp.]
MMDAETQEIFRQEAEALMEALQEGLLVLKDTPDDLEVVAGVFRALHTIKGTGAMFGFSRLASFVHNFEAAFEAVRSGNAVVTPELINVALTAYDLIADLLEGGEPDPSRDAELTAALSAATSGEAAPAVAAASVADAAAAPAEIKEWDLRFRLPQDFMEIGGNPIAMLDELREVGGETTMVRPLTDRLPRIAEMDARAIYTGWQVILPGTLKESVIRDVFMFHEDQMELSLDPVHAEASAAEVAAPAAPAEAAPAAPAAPVVEAKPATKEASKPTKAAAAPVAQLRVAADRVDLIMDRVGELVIAEARLAAIANQLENEALHSVVEDIQRLALGLRDSTMALRMTPLSSIMGRFRRLTHDLAESTGKTFDFVVEGEETELDKTVVEKLTDPLVHMLRNSVDHGLEGPEERAEAGKPERGLVKLSARHAGAEVVIEIIDDGRGMNEEAIRKRAIERGLLTEDSDVPRSEILKMVLEPGFSTAAQVTALSGRGVGADVVKQAIEALNGTIEITSEPGQGTNFTLRLPLTLAIIEGLLIGVGTERYALPLLAVEQILELPEKLAANDEATGVIELNNELVPVLRLNKVFNRQSATSEHQKIVIVGTNDTRVGLIVDEIIGTNQTVIKQLSPLHSRLKIFSGATILGDGCVALILDVLHLVSLGQDIEQRLKGNAA